MVTETRITNLLNFELSKFQCLIIILRELYLFILKIFKRNKKNSGHHHFKINFKYQYKSLEIDKNLL